MDGRAQAAYDHKTFILWQIIKSAGPHAAAVRQAIQNDLKPKQQDYKEIGNWVNARMKEHNVWVILMPVAEVNSEFMQGIMNHPDWKIAFLDNYQFLLVNTADPRGKTVIDNIIAKKAKFPNEFTKSLALAKNLLHSKDPTQVKEGFDHAVKAFEIDNSQGPMQILVTDAARNPVVSAAAIAYIQKYLDAFARNKEQDARNGGYVKRLVAAMIAADYFYKLNNARAIRYDTLTQKYKQQRKQPEAKKCVELAAKHKQNAAKYAVIFTQYKKERSAIGLRGKW
jgi:hypothetical protein